MDPADDPARDYVRLVADGYDRCAAAFNAARTHQHATALAPLFERLPERARVLDLGCGAGVPVTRALASRFDVTGVELATSQLALARAQVPEATLVHGDMRSYDTAPASFDAVVSLYAIFHLPREDHEPLMQRIARWLRPGGLLLATLAWHNESAYTEDFFGVEMHWSNYSIDEYRAMLDRCGFAVLGIEDLREFPGESHPLVLAQRGGEALGSAASQAGRRAVSK